MTKEKKIKLTRYLDSLQDKLTSKQVPLKHTNHPRSYKLFLTREIETVKKQLSDAALEGVTK